MSAAGFEVIYRTIGGDYWHHDSYHASRQAAENRAASLILSGLQVRIVEVQ
jgi:hypothetical protein